MNGHRAFFLPFYFGSELPKSNADALQAQWILDLSDQLIQLGHQEIGLISFSGFKKIQRVNEHFKLSYSYRNRDTLNVFSELDSKLESNFFHLQGRFKILSGGQHSFPNVKPHSQLWLEQELDALKQFLMCGKERVLLVWLDEDVFPANLEVPSKKEVDEELFFSILRHLVVDALVELQTLNPFPNEYQVLIKKPMYFSDLSLIKNSNHQPCLTNRSKYSRSQHQLSNSHFEKCCSTLRSLASCRIQKNSSSEMIVAPMSCHQREGNLNMSAEKNASSMINYSLLSLSSIPRSSLQRKAYQFQVVMNMIRVIKSVVLH